MTMSRPLPPDRAPPAVWWVKLAAQLVLLTYAFALLMEWTRGTLQFGGSRWAGQALVAAGALISLGHYALLKRSARGRLDAPEVLVTRGGLFGRVRHPMYLGDVLLANGLVLLHPDAIGLMLLMVIAGSVEVLSRREDASLAARFPGEHAAWRARTWRLWPGTSSRRRGITR